MLDVMWGHFSTRIPFLSRSWQRLWQHVVIHNLVNWSLPFSTQLHYLFSNKQTGLRADGQMRYLIYIISWLGIKIIKSKYLYSKTQSLLSYKSTLFCRTTVWEMSGTMREFVVEVSADLVRDCPGISMDVGEWWRKALNFLVIYISQKISFIYSAFFFK